MKKTLVALSLAIIGTASIAGGHIDNLGHSKHKKDHNMYVLGSVGFTDFRNLTPSTLGVTSADNDSTSASIGLGLKFHKHLAVEISYEDLGKYKYDNGVSFNSVKASSTNLALVGRYPINSKLDATAKLGIATTKIEDTTNGSNSHTTALYGLGIDYKIDRKWTVGSSWDRYHNFGDTNLKLDNFSVKVKYNF